jgi:phospholipid transport system transporter-binding protein
MLILPTTLTALQARDTLRMLSQALQQSAKNSTEPQLVADASSLLQFDSAALAVLLECQRLAQAWGKQFVIRQAPPKLMALAKLYGLTQLLVAEETLARP